MFKSLFFYRGQPKAGTGYKMLSVPVTSSLSSEHELAVSNTGVTVSLLNIRSLRKHSIDIRYDNNMFNSDILAFTETTNS